MTATRSTKEENRYRQLRRRRGEEGCPFCSIEAGDPQYVTETKSLKVIRNLFPYSIWDSQGVVDHLMVIPKQHTDKLGDLSAEASVEFIRLLETYEDDGYNVYARAPSSSVKTVVHQHTHLIKLDGKARRMLFMVHRPFYVRISR